jgi:hypothetical protein
MRRAGSVWALTDDAAESGRRPSRNRAGRRSEARRIGAVGAVGFDGSWKTVRQNALTIVGVRCIPFEDCVPMGKIYSTRNLEYDLIDLNGGNNPDNPRRSDQTRKVRRIVEEFRRLMFDVRDV